MPSDFVGARRFVPSASKRYQELLRAAENYSYSLPQEVRNGLLLKPLDAGNHHVHYLRAIYGALNIIDKLHLSAGSTVVDAGAGPGWLAEQFLILGYRVILLEPSSDMINIAHLRIERAAVKWEMDLLARAEFVQASIEHLPHHLATSSSADAVLFHEAWHHVIDETRAAHNVFELLAPGGHMAVLTEGRWYPGDRALEVLLEKEMADYGTLESPFTRSYMQFVLEQAGFDDIHYYHAVNGLFRSDEGRLTVEDVAGDGHEKGWNNCIARRPKPRHRESLDPVASSASLVGNVKASCDGQFLKLYLAVTNTGAETWRARAERGKGLVTLGLRGLNGSGQGQRELVGRGELAHDVNPGQTVQIEGLFHIGDAIAPFTASLVAEGSFWFAEEFPIN